jgi:formylglycine-generating enzyme required for sulfatase activity
MPEGESLTLRKAVVLPIEDMVLIPGDRYISVGDRQEREVNLKSFYIDKFEVTIAEFKKFVDASGYIPQSDREGSESLILKGSSIINSPGVNWRCDEKGKPRNKSEYNYPVIHVSFEDAEAYAMWAGKRLPTIYEMQYAAYGNQDAASIRSYVMVNAWHQGNTRKIQPVGGKAANHFGVFDIIGNVGEFAVDKDNIPSSLPKGLQAEDVARVSYSSFFQDEDQLYTMSFTIGHKKGITLFDGFRCAKDYK